MPAPAPGNKTTKRLIVVTIALVLVMTARER